MFNSSCWDCFCPKCGLRSLSNKAVKLLQLSSQENELLAWRRKRFTGVNELRLSCPGLQAGCGLALRYVADHVSHRSFYCFIGPFIVQVFGWGAALSQRSAPHGPLLKATCPLKYTFIHLFLHVLVILEGRGHMLQRAEEKSCFAIGSSCYCWDTSEEMENWTHTHPI